MSEQTVDKNEWQETISNLTSQQACPCCQRRCPCCGRPLTWGPWYRYPEYPPYYLGDGYLGIPMKGYTVYSWLDSNYDESGC